jgi:hypothetical protein
MRALVLCAPCHGRFESPSFGIAVDRFKKHVCIPRPVRTLPSVFAPVAARPEPVAAPKKRQPRQRRKIVCKACGWAKMVTKDKIAGEILYHRDVMCVQRIQITTAPVTHRGKWDSPHRNGAKIKKPKKSYCPTCRDELIGRRDALICPAGCTNIATR